MQGKLLGEVHARIPMVMVDEQHTLKLENAEAEARVWGMLQETAEGQAEAYRQLAAEASKRAATEQTAAMGFDENAATAKRRVARLKRGEDVPGGLTRIDIDATLTKAGWTAADKRYARWLHDFAETVGDEGFEEFLRKHWRLHRRADRSQARAAPRPGRCCAAGVRARHRSFRLLFPRFGPWCPRRLIRAGGAAKVLSTPRQLLTPTMGATIMKAEGILLDRRHQHPARRAARLRERAVELRERAILARRRGDWPSEIALVIASVQAWRRARSLAD